MPSYIAGAEARISERLPRLSPRDLSPRRDLAAGLAVTAVLVQVLLAQVTLALVICFLITGRISRWRPLWLVLPAVTGLGWLLASGIRPGIAGYLAGGGHLFGQLASHGSLFARLRRARAVAGSWRRWLPGQFPLALPVAAAQAALIGLLGRNGRTWDYRPGSVIGARNRYLAATLRRGEVATADGCCVGVVTGAGARAVITWEAAETGVLCTGRDGAAVWATGRDLALAAIQHRKTVIMIDLAADRPPMEWIGTECARSGAPRRSLDAQAAHYDPVSAASPARATNLIMAMVDWKGISHAEQVFCANYLNAALALIAMKPADPAWRLGPALDELPGLLAPGALQARLDRLGRLEGPRSPGISALAARVAEFGGQPGDHQAVLAAVATQFAELRSTPLGRLARPANGSAVGRLPAGPDHSPPGPDHSPPGRDQLDLARALAGREVLCFRLDKLANGRPATMLARLVVTDLIGQLAERCDLGGRYDCLAWINGCEAIGASQLGALVELGARTGTSVVLGTTAGDTAAALATEVNVIAVRGTGSHIPASDLAGREELRAVLDGPGPPDAVSLWTARPQLRHLADCEVVR
jgi:hypothetical protein